MYELVVGAENLVMKRVRADLVRHEHVFGTYLRTQIARLCRTI